jgi:hypothetical protein
MEPILAAERGMTDNGNQYALAALKERRAIIDSELRECKRRVRYLQEALSAALIAVRAVNWKARASDGCEWRWSGIM